MVASTQRQFNSMEDQPTVKTLSSLWGYCCGGLREANAITRFNFLFYFFIFLDFPIPGVTHMEIVEAGLVVVENDAISPVTVESVRLMRNQISAIEVDAFRWVKLYIANIQKMSIFSIMYLYIRLLLTLLTILHYYI